MIYKEIILDADFCIKLGSSEKYRYLELLLPLISEKIYIHEIANNEIKMNRSQIDGLIKSGKVIVLGESSLSSPELAVYKASYAKLGSVMLNKGNPNKNRGEVSSLAMAKTKGIPYFASDEMALQNIVDSMLNTGISDITCIRIEDIVNLIKNGKVPGFKRKDARAIWVIAQKKKNIFDTDIWPIE